ncbi:hypothetical protein X474_15500 [Dethiosulfatarculus sandiegensis]|uniref:Uncharacterized protein n=1 Tax=Dethiosulfatarculus sandiegensis TaxID=1429043 RepID=A0A0D2J4U2_9BACT|nr:hypothetical protein X474_15500 [Dethiosulfatarculus sandiegensis]
MLSPCFRDLTEFVDLTSLIFKSLPNLSLKMVLTQVPLPFMDILMSHFSILENN